MSYYPYQVRNLNEIFGHYAEKLSRGAYEVRMEARAFRFSLDASPIFSLQELKTLFKPDGKIWEITSEDVQDKPVEELLEGTTVACDFSTAASDINECLRWASGVEDGSDRTFGYGCFTILSPDLAAPRIAEFWALVGAAVYLPPSHIFSFSPAQGNIFAGDVSDLWHFCYIFLDPRGGRGLLIWAFGFNLAA